MDDDAAAALQHVPTAAWQEGGTAAQYFERLTQREGSCGLRVADCGEGRGKGLFVTEAVAEGDPVLVEPPLVAAQHTANKAHAQVCSHCFRYVGSIETQIAHRLLALTDKRAAAAERAAHRAAAPAPSAAPTDAEEAEEQEEEESDAESDAEGTRGPLPSREQLHALRDGETPLPHTGSFVLRARVACLGGCGEEAFCSAECAAACWEGHHQLLCVGAAGRCEGSALGRFKQHADSTNDAFHVVAQVVAATALRAAAEEGGSDAERLLRAWEPFAVGHKGVWWEVVARPSDVEVDDEAAFRQQLRDLATESAALLAQALPEIAAKYGALFRPEVYGSIVGLFELNNLALIVDPPVENYFLHIDDLPAADKAAAQLVTAPLLDALDKDYDAACEGTAYYALQACVNHSCAPNCHAMKRDGDCCGDAVLLALRPLSVGEEVTIAYVDEGLKLRERRAALRDYGFVCACPRCLDEEARRAKSKDKGKAKASKRAE